MTEQRTTFTRCSPDCTHRGPVRFILPSGQREISRDWPGHWLAGALVLFHWHTNPNVKIEASPQHHGDNHVPDSED